MKFCINQASHQGGRKNNEDRIAYSYSKDALLTVLADGMGGHRHGEIAAEIAVKSLTDAFQRAALPILANPTKFLQEQILQAHDAIEAYVDSKKLLDRPRTTLVVAIAQQNSLFVAHVGDSRLYLFREGKVVSRTQDHSKVNLMFRRGLLNFGQMGMHPERNKVYNCLGGDDPPRVELSPRIDLQEGDTVLLCSDGLWALVGDEKMADMLSVDTVTTTIPSLLELAKSRMDRKSDNTSLIAFNWGGMVTGKRFVLTAAMPLDSVTTIMLNPMQQTIVQNVDGTVDPENDIDLSDDDIEDAIAEIQAAINKAPK